MANFLHKSLYLGEPNRLTLEPIAGRLMQENFTGIINVQSEVCPYPEPGASLVAAKGYNNISFGLSETCPGPSNRSIDQRNMTLHNFNLKRNPKVTKGDIKEIISFILSSP